MIDCVNKLETVQDISEVCEAIDTDKAIEFGLVDHWSQRVQFCILKMLGVGQFIIKVSTQPNLNSKYLEADQDVFEIFETKGTDQDSWKYLQIDAELQTNTLSLISKLEKLCFLKNSAKIKLWKL